jgi:ketosteroid isomerase-like protein
MMVGAIIAKQAIRSGFDALNKGNLEKFLKAWSENCIFIYTGKVKAGGQFAGKPKVKRWFEEFIKQFPQRNFIIKHVGVENIFDMLGNNTIFAQLDLELINKNGVKCTNNVVSVVKIKGSKIIYVKDYLEISDGDDYKRGWGDIK